MAVDLERTRILFFFGGGRGWADTVAIKSGRNGKYFAQIIVT